MTKIKHFRNKSIRLAKAQICNVFLHSQVDAFIKAVLISVHCNVLHCLHTCKKCAYHWKSFNFLKSLCRFSFSLVLSGCTSSVTIVIRLSAWVLMKFLNLESGRLFEVSAYSRPGAYYLFLPSDLTWLDPKGGNGPVRFLWSIIFYRVVGLAPCPTHNREDQGFLLGWPSLSHYIHYL